MVNWEDVYPLTDLCTFGKDHMTAEWSSLNRLCESVRCIRTLVKGDRWESKLIKHYPGQISSERGTWTCTDKDGFIAEIAGTDGRDTRSCERTNHPA